LLAIPLYGRATLFVKYSLQLEGRNGAVRSSVVFELIFQICFANWLRYLRIFYQKWQYWAPGKDWMQKIPR
jgi:hypothetical protein